ncbi:unnamed protein product [Didymodactylos carnosus]|uniref:Uncharacterized protein n=1 Tax=Didymodactylos carnosus TaxID=1234261 RepID=A0A8S2GE11_9BILA|nr:unnamed protein product [Didymodactylos carnosus]CAF3500658.1 unnamed protein product [Didymodactylos carnosus]
MPTGRHISFGKTFADALDDDTTNRNLYVSSRFDTHNSLLPSSHLSRQQQKASVFEDSDYPSVETTDRNSTKLSMETLAPIQTEQKRGSQSTIAYRLTRSADSVEQEHKQEKLRKIHQHMLTKAKHEIVNDDNKHLTVEQYIVKITSLNIQPKIPDVPKNSKTQESREMTPGTTLSLEHPSEDNTDVSESHIPSLTPENNLLHILQQYEEQLQEKTDLFFRNNPQYKQPKPLKSSTTMAYRNDTRRNALDQIHRTESPISSRVNFKSSALPFSQFLKDNLRESDQRSSKSNPILNGINVQTKHATANDGNDHLSNAHTIRETFMNVTEESTSMNGTVSTKNTSSSRKSHIKFGVNQFMLADSD